MLARVQFHSVPVSGALLGVAAALGARLQVVGALYTNAAVQQAGLGGVPPAPRLRRAGAHRLMRGSSQRKL